MTISVQAGVVALFHHIKREHFYFLFLVIEWEELMDFSKLYEYDDIKFENKHVKILNEKKEIIFEDNIVISY